MGIGEMGVGQTGTPRLEDHWFSGFYELRHQKSCFLLKRKQRCRSAVGNCAADQRLCFHFFYTTVQSLYFLNPKFQDSSHLL